jgi:hypothetical protein
VEKALRCDRELKRMKTLAQKLGGETVITDSKDRTKIVTLTVEEA